MSRRGFYLTDLPAEAKPQVLQRTSRLVDMASPVMLGGKPIGWVRIGLAARYSRCRAGDRYGAMASSTR